MIKLNGKVRDFIKPYKTARKLSFKHNLSHNMTKAEIIVWDKLKNGISNCKIAKQYIFLGYIMDFYCRKAKLGIEIDGGYHNDPQQIIYDKKRQLIIENTGVKIIRFTNQQVYNDLNGVLFEISQEIYNRGVYK
jgi:very-short-patch-repair endonuclease